MSRKPLLAGLAIALAAAGITAQLLRRHPAQAVRTEPAAPVPAPAVAPAPPANDEITLAGEVEPANVVNVLSPVEGTIEQWMADAGDTVIAGRILARVRNPQLAAAEAAAELEVERSSSRIAQLESALIGARLEVSRSEADVSRTKLEFERAEKEYQRQQLMFREGITPRVVYEKSQQDYNALKADSDRLGEAAKNAVNRAGDLTRELEGARRDLEQHKAALEKARADSGPGDVRSPVEGIIVARCCQAGESVTTSTNLVQITGDLTALQVTATADSSSLERVRPGQPATIEVAGLPGAMAGRVREISRGQVIVDFSDRSSAAHPGMMAQVRIKVS